MNRFAEYPPTIISGFVLFTGLFFLCNAIFQIPGILEESTGNAWLIGIGAIFTCLGSYYLYSIRKHGLKEEGPTVTEVRTDAVSGLQSEALLTDIAKNDPSEEVRRSAEKRLAELAR